VPPTQTSSTAPLGPGHTSATTHFGHPGHTPVTVQLEPTPRPRQTSVTTRPRPDRALPRQVRSHRGELRRDDLCQVVKKIRGHWYTEHQSMLGRLVVLLSLTAPASAFDLKFLARVILGMRADAATYSDLTNTGMPPPASPAPGGAPTAGAEPGPNTNSTIPGYDMDWTHITTRPVIQPIGDLDPTVPGYDLDGADAASRLVIQHVNDLTSNVSGYVADGDPGFPTSQHTTDLAP